MPMPVFVEELRPADGIGKAGPASVEALLVGEAVAGVKTGEVLVGRVVDEEMEGLGWGCAVTMVGFS